MSMFVRHTFGAGRCSALAIRKTGTDPLNSNRGQSSFVWTLAIPSARIGRRSHRRLLRPDEDPRTDPGLATRKVVPPMRMQSHPSCEALSRSLLQRLEEVSECLE